MHKLHDLSEITQERRPTPPAIRSYRQIAAILGERRGTPISPARVKRMCQGAEAKLTRGLLADPEFRQWLHCRAARFS